MSNFTPWPEVKRKMNDMREAAQCPCHVVDESPCDDCTAREAADELCRETQADERRARYASAIGAAFNENPTDLRCGNLADAAMDVADSEFAAFDAWARSVEDDNERLGGLVNALEYERDALRAELNRLQRDMASIRGNIDNGGVSDRALIRSIKDIAGEVPMV